MKKWSLGYFNKVSKNIRILSEEFRNLIENEKVDNDKTMRMLFGKFWPEFGKFWLGSGEYIDWISFALAPHNAEYFVQFVLKEHPEMIIQLDNFLKEHKLKEINIG
jgi:hypothetical protein